MKWHDMTWRDIRWHDMMTWHDVTSDDMTWWHDMTSTLLLDISEPEPVLLAVYEHSLQRALLLGGGDLGQVSAPTPAKLAGSSRDQVTSLCKHEWLPPERRTSWADPGISGNTSCLQATSLNIWLLICVKSFFWFKPGSFGQGLAARDEANNRIGNKAW